MTANFDQPNLKLGVKSMHRFKQHGEFAFTGPLAAADKNREPDG